ncbi:MAG: type II secretion system protein, partial [Oscillibacter sp.]|nr:type II secretion system protein [Oscillibacter sp.]
MKTKRQNAGFTLVELLLAVAVIAALSGFGFVSVMQQRKNLAILEADETAKEIFLAAQEHLSMAAVEGRLHSRDTGLLGLRISGVNPGVAVRDDENTIVSYAVFDEKSDAFHSDGAAAVTLSTNSASGSHASSVMLPQGAIDDYILNHRYAVRYNAEAYRVLEVFYTADKYNFGNIWANLGTWLLGQAKVQDNPGNFRIQGDSQRPVIMGWYGEDALLVNLNGTSFLAKPTNPQGIKPGITVVNGPILYAIVALDDNYTYTEASLNIEGVKGGSASIPILDASGSVDFSSGRVFPLQTEAGDGVTYYVVILDDVTTPGHSFREISPIDAENKIVPGSDIRVTAEAKGCEKTAGDEDAAVNPVILSGKSDTVTRNSLFADGSGPQDAHIQNFRHLQNLNHLDNPADNPNAGANATVRATLDQSLYWTTFTEDVKNIHASYVEDYDRNEDHVSYTPANLDYNLNFDGKNHIIGNLVIENTDGSTGVSEGPDSPSGSGSTTGNAGVFGTLHGVSVIQNVKLDNTTVTASGASAAGALVGESTNSLTITNVQSYLEEPSGHSSAIQGIHYAGGLVGHVSGELTAEYCASYSKTGIPGTVEATGNSGAAGGLFGAVETVYGQESSVTGCAAANLVRASTEAGSTSMAGGLIGYASGEIDVSRSYVGGHTENGGLYHHDRDAVSGTEKLDGNVQGAYAGGFIGQVSSAAGTDVTLDRVYSTASAYGSTEAGSLYPASVSSRINPGSSDSTPFHSYGAGEFQGAGAGQTGGNSIQTGNIPAYHSDLTTKAKPYDGELPSMYPYDSLWDMSTDREKSDASAYEWMGKHIGDWPGSSLHPGITLHNEEILYAEVLLDQDCDY